MTDPLFIRSRPRWWYVLAILVAGALIWYFMSRGQAARAGGPAARGAGQSQPTPVRTVTAEIKPLPVYLKAIGTVTPLNAVTVKSRVDGELLRIAFQEGERVERGQLLAEIDPVSYRIRLAQAEGQMQQSAAQVEIARSDLERLRNLHGQKLVTNQELERQQALVAERAGALAAMQGQVDDARLQLGYTRVEAPIGGRVGLRRVDAGNLVHASDPNGIVSIVQTQPIAVGFTLPEADLPAVLDSLRAGETLPVEAWDRGEGSVLAAGILRTVDNQIDTATGTVRLKAEFSNDDDRLMNLSHPFIQRPVATALLMVALLLSGIMAYRLLPVAALPQVDFPTIQIFHLLSRREPGRTASAITAPLERHFGQIPGRQPDVVRQFGRGLGHHTPVLARSPMGVAEQEVQAAINAAGALLPNDLPTPPVYRKVNPADTPIVTSRSPRQPAAAARCTTSSTRASRRNWRRFPGVGMVSLAGGQRPAVRVQVNPAELAARGLGFADVRAAINAASVNQPKGSFDGPCAAS
jgi:multidrug efflux system membrane fusion protein